MNQETTSADVRHDAPQVALLPIGSFEQHGDFMPLATDSMVASAIAAGIAAAYNVLLLPTIPISCSHEHSSWPGTVSITHQTLASIVADVVSSLEVQGIHRLAVINGHGGNYVLSNVVQTANAARPASMTLFPTRGDWNVARRDAGLETDAHEDMHAGELEVSILAAVNPSVLRDGVQTSDHLASDRDMLLVHGMAAYTENGVIGKPSAGTAVKGKALLESLVRSFASHFDALGKSD